MWLLTPLLWLSFAGYGYWIATIKRRNPAEGIGLGLVLGPLGCVIEANLAERTVEQIEAERLQSEEEGRAQREAWEARRSAMQADAARAFQAARLRADAARVRRAEVAARLLKWLDRTVLKFGWYKALPEVAQPIVLGLLIALPPVIVLLLVFGGR